MSHFGDQAQAQALVGNLATARAGAWMTVCMRRWVSWEHGPELEQLKDESLAGELVGGGGLVATSSVLSSSVCGVSAVSWAWAGALSLPTPPAWQSTQTEEVGDPSAGTGVPCLHHPSWGHLGWREGLWGAEELIG